MSFEGYYQLLCKAGHADSMDCSGSFSTWRCDASAEHGLCDEPLAWAHLVDQTNGDGEAVTLEEAAPDEYETCPTCQHSELIKEARYRIPEPKSSSSRYPHTTDCCGTVLNSIDECCRCEAGGW